MSNTTNNTTATKETLEVDLEKIERLVNKVADLVITNSMMNQMVENLQNEDDKKSMQGTVNLFERHIKEMQDYTMELRMINMLELYEHLPSYINEVAQKNDKSIELKTFGDTTKVDKSMMQLLSNIIDALLDNAVTHGIENKTTRLEKNKPEQGLISIKTEQVNGQIVITIQDDGKGIDIQTVCQKALQNNHITEADLAAMKEKEKASLILFDKSMSKIKHDIETINGDIFFDTQKDMGTTVSIYIPLSLSILDGLNIRIGEHYFILPTNSIVESIQPNAENLKAVGDGSIHLLMLRDDFIPIIKMYEYLNIESEHNDLTKGILVVVKSENEKIALFIDEFLNQQQIVVKPIESNFKDVIGISGATVRGDGSIGLIIDIKSIIEDKKHLYDLI